MQSNVGNCRRGVKGSSSRREMYTPPHPSQSEKTELGHGFIEP